jgi:hypothetical protein
LSAGTDASGRDVVFVSDGNSTVWEYVVNGWHNLVFQFTDISGTNRAVFAMNSAQTGQARMPWLRSTVDYLGSGWVPVGSLAI